MKKIVSIFLVLVFVAAVFAVPGAGVVGDAWAATGDNDSGDTDFEKYLKYDKFKKDDRRSKYRKYKKMKEKYGFDSSEEKFAAKACYRIVRDLRKAGVDKWYLKATHECYEGYKDYKRYKKYYRPVKKYKKYKKYNKKEYDKDGRYDKYDRYSYKRAYERYKKSKGNNQANLGGGSLGPTISVGLHDIEEDELEDDSFRIRAYEPGSDDELPYKILDKNGKLITNVAAGEQTRVKYIGGRNYVIYNFDGTDEDTSTTTANRKITFQAKNSGDVNDIYFEIYHSSYGSSYDQYRDKIQLSHYDPSGGSNDRIWIVNYLPLEHYVWGMGEIRGTGDMDHNRVMTISYRTYGYWKIKYSTRYAAQGFKVDATSGNQIYRGYVWETTYDRIKPAAQDTRAKIVLYDGRIAITPYSSWTDGRTRSWKEKWGSSNYPWCQSVRDPYGKHPSKSTRTLFNEGNHMVGLSAHGSVDRADAGWSYTRILEYYFEGIDIFMAY